MGLRRAVAVDRDPGMLASLTVELGRSGFTVETFASTVGLTPDLLALGRPDFLVIDGGLKGLDAAALLVLVRSMKARLPVRIALSTEQDPVALAKKTGADVVVTREQLRTEGVKALGLVPGEGERLDVRAILDEVLGRPEFQPVQVLKVKLDLFSESRLFISRATQGSAGVFVATSLLPPLGQQLQLELELFGKNTVRTPGEVVWHRSRDGFSAKMAAGIGVKLLDVSEPDRALIDRYLEVREPLLWTA